MELKAFEKNLFNQLEKFDEICFGPNCGEFGWEIIIISPLIKLFKKVYPNKKVYVSTREDRKELYLNSGLDDIIVFNIDGDYKTVTPRTNTLKGTPKNTASRPIDLDIQSVFSNIKEKIKEKYPNVIFFSFDNLPFTSSPQYDFSSFDFDLKSDPINKTIIENIIKKNKEKKIITIFPRHRIDLAHRNWTEKNWKDLYKKLNDTNEYLIFVSGKSPSYIKPPKRSKNIFNLEDLTEKYNSSTILGLTIEAIKHSRFTFGPQTAGILLSNIFKIPTVYFGKEENLVSDRYNPFKTKHFFINVQYSSDYEYIIDIDTVFKSIKFFDDNMHVKNLSEIKVDEYEIEHVCKFPSFNPDLIGLEGDALQEKIREINSNPNYKIPMIETTVRRKLLKLE